MEMCCIMGTSSGKEALPKMAELSTETRFRCKRAHQGNFSIASSDGKSKYEVDIDFHGNSCSCKAFEFSRKDCKHIAQAWSEMCTLDGEWNYTMQRNFDNRCPDCRHENTLEPIQVAV